MRSKKGTFAVIAVMVVLIGIVCAGLMQDFDAQGYVAAVMDHRFQGKTAGAEEMIGEVTEEELEEQYENEIKNFAAHHIISGVEVSPEQEAAFEELCKKIFASMKYKVHKAEKINRKEYCVSVEYEPADVFLQFVEGIREETERLKEKAGQLGYQGTKEEINREMQAEFLGNAYKILESAYENMQYEEPEKMDFQIAVNDKNVFFIREEEISQLITKILRLDEIQD